MTLARGKDCRVSRDVGIECGGRGGGARLGDSHVGWRRDLGLGKSSGGRRRRREVCC